RSRAAGDGRSAGDPRAAAGDHRQRRLRLYYPRSPYTGAQPAPTHHEHQRSVPMTLTPEATKSPALEPLTQQEAIASLGTYGYGWADSDVAGASAQRGLSEEVVRDISAKKNEPEWMLKTRLKGLKLFRRKPMPGWGSDLSGIYFENIKYFVRSTEKQAASWDDLPADIKSTYDK